MSRLRLTLAYDGAAFAGSQIQPGMRTVQGVVESALATLDGRAVRAVFAGRTDTGVHALGQVAHADVRRERPMERWRRGLNGVLPPDVRVTNVEQVPDRFHARYDATGREYRYTIWNGEVQPPLLRGTSWHRRSPLDVGAMGEAARALIGEHDFAAFAGAGAGLPGGERPTVRTMRAASWAAAQRAEAMAGVALEFTIEGSGFLPHMVRNVVGSLVMIGAGGAPMEWMATLLRGRDRRLAAPTAPAHGLTLWRVRYDERAMGEQTAVTDSVTGRAGERDG